MMTDQEKFLQALFHKSDRSCMGDLLRAERQFVRSQNSNKGLLFGHSANYRYPTMGD